MRRLLLKIMYDGTSYHGWQVQPNGVTVQEVLGNTLETIIGEKPKVSGCSRTDAGVHANEFCCHFDTENEIDVESIVRALNCRLPKDISALKCIEVNSDFHARYSSLGKSYIYKIYNNNIRNPFKENYYLTVKHKLNAIEMNDAAKEFIGKYDFKAFCASHSSVEDTVRTISECSVKQIDDDIIITITANGFLYNMVRIIVGTLIDVSDGKIIKQDIKHIINSKDRSKAGKTVAAKGLYLNKVLY